MSEVEVVVEPTHRDHLDMMVSVACPMVAFCRECRLWYRHDSGRTFDATHPRNSGGCSPPEVVVEWVVPAHG